MLSKKKKRESRTASIKNYYAKNKKIPTSKQANIEEEYFPTINMKLYWTLDKQLNTSNH